MLLGALEAPDSLFLDYGDVCYDPVVGQLSLESLARLQTMSYLQMMSYPRLTRRGHSSMLVVGVCWFLGLPLE